MKTRARKSLNGGQSPQSKVIGRTVPKCSFSNNTGMHCEEKRRRSTSSSVKSSKPFSPYKTCKSMSQTNIDLYGTSPQHKVWSSLKRTSTPFVLGENGDENSTEHGQPIFKIIDDEVSFNLNSSRHFLIESTTNESQGRTRPRRTQEMTSETNLLKRGRDGGTGMLEMQPPNKKSKRTSSTHQSNELNPSKKSKRTSSTHQSNELNPSKKSKRTSSTHQSNELNPSKKIKKSIAIKDNHQQKESLLLSSNSKTKLSTMDKPTVKLLAGKKKLQNSMNEPIGKLLIGQKNLQKPMNGPNAKILTDKKKLQNSMNGPNAKLLTGKKKLQNSMNGPTAKLLTCKKELRKTESRVSKTSLRTLSFSRVGNSDHKRLRKRSTNSVKSTTSQKIDGQLKGLPTPQEVSLNKTPNPDVTSSPAKKITRASTGSKLMRTSPTETKKSTSTARKSSQANNSSDLQKPGKKTRLAESLKKTDIVVLKKSTFQGRAINLSRRRNSQNKTKDSQMLKTLPQVSVENKKYAILKRRTFPTQKSTNKSSLSSESHKSEKDPKSATHKSGRTGLKNDTFESVQEIVEKKARPKNAGCGAKQSVVKGEDKMAFYDTNNLHGDQTNLINDTIRKENNENSQYFSPTTSGSLMAQSKALRRTKQSPTTQSAREISRKTLTSTKNFVRADGKKQKTRNRQTIVKKADRLLSLSVNKAGEENKPTKEIGEKTISASRNETDSIKSNKVNDTSSARRSLFAERTKQTSSVVSKTKHTPNQDTTQKRYFGYRTFPIIITNNQSTNTSVRKLFPGREGHYQDTGNKRITSQRKSERLSSSSHNLSAGANMPFENLTQSGKLLRSSLVHNGSIVVPLASQINKLKGKDVDVVAKQSQDKKQGESQSLTLVTRSSEERKDVSPLLVHQKSRRNRVRKITKKSFKTADRKLRSDQRSSTPNKRDTTLISPLKVFDKTEHTPAGKTHTITVSASKKKGDGSEQTKVDVEVKVVKQWSTRSTTAVRHDQMEQRSSKLAKSLQERSTQTSFEIFTPSPIAVRTPQHRRKSTQTDTIISKIIESANQTNIANIIESTEQTDFANFMESTEQTQKSTKVNTKSEEIISKRAKKNLGTINANTHKKKRLDSAISTNNHVDKLKEKLPKSKSVTQFKKSASVQHLTSLSLLSRKDKLKVTSLSQSALSLNEILSNSKKHRNSLLQQSNGSNGFLKGDLILTQKKTKAVNSNNAPSPRISPKGTLTSLTNPANCLTKKAKKKRSVIHKKMLSVKKPSGGNNLNKVAPNEVGKRASNANVRKTFEENLANHTQFKKSPRITNRLSLSFFEKIGQNVPLRQNKLNENSLNQNSMKQNSREKKSPKQNTLKQKSLKQNTFKQKSLKQNSINQNSFKENSIKQNSFKQNSLKQNSRVRRHINYSSVKLIYSDRKSVPHSTLGKKSTVILPKIQQTPKIRPKTEKAVIIESLTRSEKLPLTGECTESTSNQQNTSSSSFRKKRNSDNVKKQISFRSKRQKSETKVKKPTCNALAKKQAHKRGNNRSLPSFRKTARNLSRLERLSLNAVLTPAMKQSASMRAQGKELANQNNPSLTLTCALATQELDVDKNASLQATDTPQESQTPLTAKKLEDKLIKTPPSTAINKNNINAAIIQSTGSIKAKERKSKPRRSEAGVETSLRISMFKLSSATSPLLKTRQPETANKVSTEKKTGRNHKSESHNVPRGSHKSESHNLPRGNHKAHNLPRRNHKSESNNLPRRSHKSESHNLPRRSHKSESHNLPRRNHKSHNLPMKTHENANKVLNNAENNNKPIDASQEVTCTSQPKTRRHKTQQEVTCTSQPKTRRHKTQQKTSSRKTFIPSSSITGESQKRIRGIRHARDKQTNFKTGRPTRSAIDLREKDLPHLQKQPNSQILTPIKRSGRDLQHSYKRPSELTRRRLSRKKSKLRTVGVKTVLPKLVVTESSPSNNLDLDVNYDHLLSRYSVQHENPPISIHAEEAEGDIDLPQTREAFESDYGRRMLRMLCREEVLRSPYRHHPDKLVDDFDYTWDSSLYDISQDEQNGDLDRDEMLKYIGQKKLDVDEFPNLQLEERTIDSFQNEEELYENHSIITDASYQNDIDDFEGLIPIDHASQSQHCIIS